MPKKYKSRSLLTKPSASAHSNLSLTRPSDLQNVPVVKTVNDLIKESRRDAGNARPQSIQTASSIHPALRAVLDIPTPPPPTPRAGIRGPTRLRRIPGPPPPRSWLVDSVHASPEAKNVQWSKAHERTRVHQQSSILPEGDFPGDRSLRHNIMKSIASQWAWHVEYDHEYLAELPTKVKETLLSYLAIYNEAKGPNPLGLLFPGDLDLAELDEVRRLDLGNAIGRWTTLMKVERNLIERRSVPANDPTPWEHEIPDSWDGDEYEELSIPAIVTNSGIRFRNLKHLSLAIAPGTISAVVSWADLLAFASKLSTISSLSLAFWPQPTYTPNASTSMSKIEMTSSGTRPQVLYGGTNYYSIMDNDWQEAAGILRTLSRLLYCLKWLDLTGCGEWFPALTWSHSNEGNPTGGQTGPDWNGSWRGMDHLILATGWSPTSVSPQQFEYTNETEQASDEALEHAQESIHGRRSTLPSQLQSIGFGLSESYNDTHSESWDVENEREKYYHKMEVARHKKICRHAKDVAQRLRSIRKDGGGRWINVEFDSPESI